MPSKTQMERSFAEMIRPFKGGVVTTGSTFWVDSVTGSDATGKGRSKENPVATLNYAYDLCTANKGDVIYALPGHAEAIANATTLVMDTDGISIVGLGSGADRPEVSFSATAGNIPITGADNTIRNIYFNSDTSAIVIGITITGTDTLIEDCEFNQALLNAHVIEWIRIGAVNNDANNSTIRGCKFYGIDADHENDILIWKDQIGLTIEGNWCQGDYNTGTVTGAIAADSAENMLNILVKDNVIVSAASDQGIAINLDGGTNTGLLVGNYASAPDADWTPFIAAGCAFQQNYGSGVLASSGYLYPLADS